MTITIKCIYLFLIRACNVLFLYLLSQMLDMVKPKTPGTIAVLKH